jgi:hypothetical protein
MDPSLWQFILLTCALPLLIAFLYSRSGPTLPNTITVIGGSAVSLTLLGLLLFVGGMGTRGSAGLNTSIFGLFLTIVGFPCACFGCGLALGAAQRLGQQAWFVVLLFTALFPLVAALVVALAIFTAFLLALEFALIGAGAVLAYGVLGRRAERPNV